MGTIIDILKGFYNYVIYDLADPRTKGFFFLDDPIRLVVLLVAYNLFVLKIGQDWMRNRQPFNIKPIILAFDFFQIIINGLVFYHGIKLGWFWKFSFFCYEIDMSDNDFTKEATFWIYVYYLVKLTDLLDTIFFILRKKFNHITFLHVYHHTGMVLLTWGAAKYIPGGHHTFIGVINSLVHMIMYSYYLITTVYPQNKLFRIKKFVTEIQMYQFLVAFIHMGFILFTPDCVYPRFVLFILLPNNLMIFLLFYNFYRKTYFPKQKKVKSS